MSKRFIDTELFRKQWFRRLPQDYKLFWVYVLTNCDISGVWEVDFDQAIFFGCKVDEKKAIDLLEKQVFVFGNGKRWFIIDFCDFQYGKLSTNSPVHKKIIQMLENHKIDDLTLYHTLSNRVFGRVKEKEEDKDKEEDKEEEPKIQKINYAEFVKMLPAEYLKLESELGIERAKKAVEILNNFKGSKGTKYKSDYLAIRSWVIKRIQEDETKLNKSIGKVDINADIPKNKVYSNEWA